MLLGLVQGAVVTWDKLPSWAKWLLVGLGVAAGVAIVVDTLPADVAAAAAAAAGLASKLGISIPGLGGGGGPPGVTVAKSWNTGNVTFYLATTGRIYWKKKNGVWKSRRPPKPIVMFKGKMSLKTFLKADRAVKLEAAKIKAAVAKSNAMVQRKLAETRPARAPRRRQAAVTSGLIQELVQIAARNPR